MCRFWVTQGFVRLLKGLSGLSRLHSKVVMGLYRIFVFLFKGLSMVLTRGFQQGLTWFRV